MELAAPTRGEIDAARGRIAGYAIRTPLVRWQGGDSEIWLKLETLQPIGSFKIRGARSALALAPAGLLARGVFTASAGNMAQGVAWCARAMGIPCTVVVPDHAPAAKIEAVERLGAAVVRVPFARWWRVLEERQFEGLPGFFVHPVSDSGVIAGNGTVGLEIAEDLPGVDVVLVPYGGGGLSSGIAAALRSAAPNAKVIAVEPDTAAPLAASLRAGKAMTIEYQASFVDGSGGKAVLAEMWPLAKTLLAGSVTVSLDEAAEAIRQLVIGARVVAEGAGALAFAAARSGQFAGKKVVAVVSGGNIDPSRLTTILQGGTPS